MNLPTDFQTYIHQSKYARWNPQAGRRETWRETVGRYFDFFIQHLNLKDMDLDIFYSILNLEVMPSMRCLMTAGPALERDHIAGYNCAYTPINRVEAFDEILYILMCGTGVGFSVERQYTEQLPEVPLHFDCQATNSLIIVPDSRSGWAWSLGEFIWCLYQGVIPSVDFSRIRPKGSRLNTMGGQASGPEPLKEVFSYGTKLFIQAAGRKLTPLEVHDLVCKIAECVVVGGVRRSALLSLSDLGDVEMRSAKAGSWWSEFPHRALANNSICYANRPSVGQFMDEWLSLYNSRSGERGIFNRDAIKRQVLRNGRRNLLENATSRGIEFGTNPCSEIILRPNQFCNLSEVVCRETDDLDDLARKVRVASILGTWQASLTDFRYIGKEWKVNCEEERLLGVSLTGVMDCEFLMDIRGIGNNLAYVLEELKKVAVETNREEAECLGIAPATAVTCVKPSGTVSQLVNSASGLHPRYAPFYIRRTRELASSPMAMFLRDQGVPCEPDLQLKDHLVFSWPQKSPRGAVTKLTAIEHLELWKVFQDHWCEHKPSVTVTVEEDEWPSVGAWVWKHFDEMSGVSFLPSQDNHIYPQAPFESISETKYDELLMGMPVIKWDELSEYEMEDTTTGSRELTCSAGGQCEI